MLGLGLKRHADLRRFYSRHFLQGQLRSPDWVMLAALVSCSVPMKKIIILTYQLTTWGTPIVNWYQVIYTDYSHVHVCILFYDRKPYTDSIQG